MYAAERHELIAADVARVGRVAVAELAQRFQVTTETVRRDLEVLEERGALRRVHGGAVAMSKSSLTEPSIADREVRARDAKMRIAHAAMRMLPPKFGGSVLIDAGTTTASLATLLADGRPADSAPLTVITNSVPIAALLHRAPGIELHLLGGRVRGLTSAAVGSAAVSQLHQLRPDIAFIGTNGISGDFGLSTPDEDEAAVKAAMVRGARRAVALADASKLSEEALFQFAELADLDALVTDGRPPEPLASALAAADVEVVIA